MQHDLEPVLIKDLLSNQIDTPTTVKLHEMEPSEEVPSIGLDSTASSIDASWRRATETVINTKFPTVHSPPVGYLEFQNVLVFGVGSLVTADRKKLIIGPEVSYPNNQHVINSTIDWWKEVSSKDQTVKLDQAIMVGKRGVIVYGHWILDILPALYSLPDEILNDDHQMLLTNAAPKFSEILTESAGLPTNRILRYDHHREVLYVERLIFPLKPNDYRVFHPSARQFFMDWTAKHRSTKADGPKKLYVARKLGGYNRKDDVTNAERFRNEALNLGFEIIFPEDFPIEQQIELFSQASVVAGEAGSGLHNTVFSPSGTAVIEIRDPGYPSRMQGAIAQLLGHNYYPLLSKTEFEEGLLTIALDTLD